MQSALFNLDCRVAMEFFMAENSVDAIVTDPPYGLGFMGKGWDRGVPGVEFWQHAYRVLKPGGHMLAFGGTRTYHRLVTAIEDAGFEVRDQILWVYGSGFPKSHNGEWGGTALKPAVEPIVMVRKPLQGTVAENWTTWGTGALNIDTCRIATSENLNGGAYAKEGGRSESQSLHGGTGMNVAGKTVGKDFVQPAGRWPANLIHDGSDAVVGVFPQAPGQLAKTSTANTLRNGQHIYGDMVRGSNGSEPRGDAGSAARFFYCAKASKTERGADNTHPTVKPVALMAYLCRLVTPAGGVVFDPFMGSGSTGKAALREGFRFVGCDDDESYFPIARARTGL